MRSEKSTHNVDALDARIIKELLQNSRKPITEIAKEYGVTALTVNNRLSELKEKEIVTGSSVIVDFANFEAEGLAVLKVNVNTDQIKLFLKDIQNLQGPFFFSAQQRFDKSSNIFVVSLVRDLNDLEKLKESLKQHSAVIDIQTNIWTYMKVNPANLEL
jgi:DNA-binding Lrp family transcriptional regulator